ncbi:MAG: hypothetical protein WB998_01235 [Solirubrobacteraceae bacterium]
MSSCSKCGLPLQEGQDWCLQCGTGKPGSLGTGPGWRTGIAILATTALLVIGASVAAYAALNKSTPKPKVAVAVVKGLGSTTAPTTTPTTPGAVPPTSTPTPGTPTTVKSTTPPIPLQTPTPKSASGADNEANNALFPPETKTTKTTKTSTPTKTTGETTAPKESGGSENSETKTESESSAEGPSPILLDTDAASVYNPYAYPATLFGDPSLAIDGEEKTAWTAQVQAADAPKMAEGLLLDLKSPQKLGSVAVKTTTTGITVEVYGAVGKTPPASISAPAWKRLAGLKVLTKKTTTLKLRTAGKGYRYVVLWLAKAPASSTAAAPGTVSINEFELFPPK